MTLPLIVLVAFAFGLAFGLLFRVFHRPRRVSYIPLGESKYVEIDGIKIHFIQKGLGPSLVLVHGLASSIWCWADVLNKLARDYFVTAVDLPGFGLSDKRTDIEYGLDEQAERLAKFLDALGIRRAHFLGCSMGGAICLWLARTRPDLVDRTVTISPATNPRVVPVNPKTLVWLVHVLKYFIVTPFLVRQISRKAFAKYKKLSHTQIMQYYLPYHKCPDAAVTFWKSQELLRDLRLPDGLKEVSRPTLILYGQCDQVIGERDMHALTRIIPNSKLILHPSGGHHLMTDEPGFVVSEVKTFLTGKPLTLVE